MMFIFILSNGLGRVEKKDSYEVAFKWFVTKEKE
jgi:hypothetical protein